MSQLFSFQGKVWSGERLANGSLSRPVWAGNVPACSLKLSTSATDKVESFSGKRLQYGRLQKGTTAQIDITFDEWLPKNIAAAIWQPRWRSLRIPSRVSYWKPAWLRATS